MVLPSMATCHLLRDPLSTLASLEREELVSLTALVCAVYIHHHPLHPCRLSCNRCLHHFLAIPGHVSVVKGSDAEKEAWLCSPSGDDRSAGCILTGAVSPSGKVFVASASLFAEEGTSSSGASSGGDGSGRATRKSLVVKVAQFARFANNVVDETVASFVVSDLPSLGHGRQGAFEAAHLEARDKGDHCSPKDHPEACFRALMVNEDDSAMMVGREGVEWVREEALAAVDKVRGASRMALGNV